MANHKPQRHPEPRTRVLAAEIAPEKTLVVPLEQLCCAVGAPPLVLRCRGAGVGPAGSGRLRDVRALECAAWNVEMWG